MRMAAPGRSSDDSRVRRPPEPDPDAEALRGGPPGCAAAASLAVGSAVGFGSVGLACPRATVTESAPDDTVSTVPVRGRGRRGRLGSPGGSCVDDDEPVP